MMGTVWAATANAMLLPAPPAYGEAGIDAKMAFPDLIGGLNDRNTKQCLVESLGNRECLVYRGDESLLLYRGANTELLLERLQTAAQSLQAIPSHVEKQEWSKITGILTGPMGQFGATLTSLASAASASASTASASAAGSNNKNNKNADLAKKNAQKVKNDLFMMGTATTQRQGDVILQYHQAAIKDLDTFLKSL
jgi:hypothetical protein